MKTLILSIALVAFTFVSCDQSQAPTQPKSSSAMSKATVERDIPIDFGCFEMCPGCCVCLTGTIHEVTNANGTQEWCKITGYGYDCTTGERNGTTYSGADSEHFGGKVANFSTRVSSHDGGCSLRAHFVMNAKGEISVDKVTCE